MNDPTTWDAGDHHSWVYPVGEPCPNCECCSANLCARAIEKDSACHFEGGPSNFDLSKCPCWRTAVGIDAPWPDSAPDD